MRSYIEIKSRIDELAQDIKNINARRSKNYLLHIDEMNEQITKLTEINYLSWVLDEPVPDEVYNYIE